MRVQAVEEQADAVAVQSSELLELRAQIGDAHQRYARACEENAELRCALICIWALHHDENDQAEEQNTLQD